MIEELVLMQWLNETKKKKDNSFARKEGNKNNRFHQHHRHFSGSIDFEGDGRIT
jgi:hypothetical protein